MVVNGFETSLASLKGTTATASNANRFPEPGLASVDLLFSDGSRMRADYWRIIQGNRAGTSSFDHMQKSGLPAPIDAFLEIAKLLDGATVREATWNARTGDMMFQFESDTELQVFNFTGYEAWKIHFANGTGEYSPYAR
jgi:hypothetical protein